MNLRIRNQRGVATVLAVLFLLVVIGFALIMALRMAGTEADDSALQHQSVEALMLAESGIERAARRYRDDATLCTTGTLVEGPVTVSTGKTFSILSSSGTASQCTITARGSIGNIQRTVSTTLRRTGGGGGGGVVADGGFNNPSAWDKPALVSGGALVFTQSSDDEQKATYPNGLTAISPNPGAVANTLSFSYQIVGSVNFRIQIKRSSGGNITINYNGASALSGSGTITVGIGTFNPNVITEIEIEIIGNSVGSGESLTLDNLYVGPTSGAGGAATVAVQSWQEVVP